MEPKDRGPQRRRVPLVVCTTQPHPAVQWLWRAGGIAVYRHGPAQVFLRPAALARLLAHALALTPMLWLLHAAWLGQLGADPVAALTHRSGHWAPRPLLPPLAVLPLRSEEDRLGAACVSQSRSQRE